ncbi:MAG: HAD-IIB family hydrolase [Acidimicrobiia bacterium]
MATRPLLATDLDGTFIGDQTEMLALWHDLNETGIRVAFSTGRHLASIRAFLTGSETTCLPAACICMVGTEIWHVVDNEFRRDDAWTDEIDQDWDRAVIDGVVRAVCDAEPQPSEWQSEFKSSWYMDRVGGSDLVEISNRLEAAGVAAKIVASAERFLDIVPSRSGKGGAVRFLAERLNLGMDQVVTAGDTGNDLDMMPPALEVRSIAVGNATEELRHHEASGLYHADAPFAAGIREGLVHYGWLDA